MVGPVGHAAGIDVDGRKRSGKKNSVPTSDCTAVKNHGEYTAQSFFMLMV